MDQAELLAKIQEFQNSLSPEERLNWLREMSDKIVEMNEEVKSLAAALQEAKDEEERKRINARLNGQG